jgi:PAS domain S-box-containing protein
VKVGQKQKQPQQQSASAALDIHQTRAVRALLLITGVGAPIVGVAIFLREGWSTLFLLAVITSAAIGLLWFLLERGQVRTATLGLVLMLLIASTAGTVYNGSVRSGAAIVMLASIVVAGNFLSRSVALWVGAYIVAILGLLNLLEQQGALTGSLRPVGWTVWVLQAVVTGAILISSLYGRYRLMQVVRDQETALGAAQTAEANLRASQQRFEALFNRNPVASMVHLLDSGTVVDANEAFCEMFQYTKQGLVGQPIPPVWVNEAQRQVFHDQIRSTGSISAMPAIGRRSDGSIFQGQVHAEVLLQGDEKIVVAMVLDVSVEATSRRALEKSRDRFAKVFQFSPLGMVISREADNRILEINRANENVLGRARVDALGKTPKEIGIWYSEEDRVNIVASIQKNARLERFETRMRNKQGEPVSVRVWSEPIDLDGEACRLTFMLNIADEKRRETTLTNIAEGVSGETGEAFFLSLAEHLASAVSADGILIAERTHAGTLDTWALIDHGQRRPNRSIGLNHSVYERLLACNGLEIIAHPNNVHFGHSEPYDSQSIQLLAGMPLHDADGSAIGLLMVVWNTAVQPGNDVRSLISIFGSRCAAELIRMQRDREIGQLNETLEQRVAVRTAQLEYLNRELDSFAYSVSHDLKSPLRAIDGFLQILHEQMADRMTPSDEEIFQRASSSASRMGSLINDLLSLARASQGQLQRMDVNINELVESVLRHERDRDPTHTIEIHVAPNLRANCDLRMAQIVLENLIGNAWKYGHKSPSPRIELGQDPRQPGEAPVFYIKDNGAGFDEQFSNRLFRPFSRLHTASEFEGSGIGLATVRRILERHGGHIRAQSQLGEGACFWFSFGHPTPD